MAAQKRHRGRRRRGRFGFLYVVLSFVLILVCLVVGSVVFFRANTITVAGNERYTASQVIAAAQVEPGENLFRVNRPQTYQRILAALPYIRDVNIRRELPDALVITVTETRSAAFLTCQEGTFLLDTRGKLVEQAAAAPAGLPEVTGLSPLSPTVGAMLAVDAAQQTRLDGLTGLLTALEEQELLSQLGSVDVTSSSEILFTFTNRFTVRMPLTCDHSYKVRALQYAVEHLEENETGLLDLTREDETHFIPQ